MAVWPPVRNGEELATACHRGETPGILRANYAPSMHSTLWSFQESCDPDATLTLVGPSACPTVSTVPYPSDPVKLWAGPVLTTASSPLVSPTARLSNQRHAVRCVLDQTRPQGLLAVLPVVRRSREPLAVPPASLPALRPPFRRAVVLTTRTILFAARSVKPCRSEHMSILLVCDSCTPSKRQKYPKNHGTPRSEALSGR